MKLTRITPTPSNGVQHVVVPYSLAALLGVEAHARFVAHFPHVELRRTSGDLANLFAWRAH